MDATRRTTAGVLAITALMIAALALGRCTERTAALEPPPAAITADANSWDMTDHAGQALAHLDDWINTMTTTTTQPIPAAAPTAVPTVDTPLDRWDALANCETGGNWATDTGNGYHGGLQFAPTTWTSMGGLDYAPTANQATREQQITIAEKVLAAVGWSAWPGCTRKLGWR